jgi:DNA-3-methyladenine glycosylase II
MRKMTFTETFKIEALAPFNFDLTAQIFQSGDKQIRTYSNGQFTQVLKLNGKLAMVKLVSTGTIDQPKITVELKSSSPIILQDMQKTEEAVKFIFNLDFDLCSFYSEVKNDCTMTQIAQQLYGLKNPTTPTVFEALVDSIVEQQISIKVAHALEERLVKKFGEILTLNEEHYYAYPTPQNIAIASIEEIQDCGLSQRKAEYIQQTAELIVNGKLDLEHLKTHQNPEEIIAELDEIRGIGVWTAELTMLRGMQKLDALPADDFGIRRVISRYYCRGKPIKSGEAREIAKSWGRWKGLAAFYLIIAEVKDIKV